MSITFRSASASGGSTPQALAVPAGVVNGDLLIMCAVLGGTGANGSGFNTLGGWTLLEHLYGGTAISADVTTWCRIANSEPASYTPTPQVGTGSTVLLSGAILAYRSVVPISSIKSVASSIYYDPLGFGATTSPNPGSLTGATIDDMAVICYGWEATGTGGNPPSFTTPAGWTSRADTYVSSSRYSPGLKVVEKSFGTDTPAISSGISPGVWSIASTALTGSLPSTGMLTFF